MKEKIKYSRCSLSIEDLEKFRDEEGFIHLDEAGIQVEEGSKSQVRK